MKSALLGFGEFVKQEGMHWLPKNASLYQAACVRTHHQSAKIHGMVVIVARAATDRIGTPSRVDDCIAEAGYICLRTMLRVLRGWTNEEADIPQPGIFGVTQSLRPLHNGGWLVGRNEARGAKKENVRLFGSQAQL